jgi:two-component system chemotaxis response regulator CheY
MYAVGGEHGQSRRGRRMSQLILVVDDSMMVRRHVRLTIEQLGYAVEEAADGTAALEAVARARPALIISDVNMAPMDGFTLLSKLRLQYTREVLPVLMLTTENDDALKARGKNAGANGWLVKPFDPQKLGDVVSHVLSKAAPAAKARP